MRRTIAVCCFASGALVLLAFAAPGRGVPPLFLRNTGHSMPLGFYRFAHLVPPVAVGEIIVLPHPPHHREPWLMKRVAAVAPASYCWREDLGTHTLNGKRMPPPSRLALVIGVPVWKGCRRLEPGEVVGYGDSEDSYDSRYLGPIETGKLWGVYEPFLAKNFAKAE